MSLTKSSEILYNSLYFQEHKRTFINSNIDCSYTLYTNYRVNLFSFCLCLCYTYVYKIMYTPSVLFFGCFFFRHTRTQFCTRIKIDFFHFSYSYIHSYTHCSTRTFLYVAVLHRLTWYIEKSNCIEIHLSISFVVLNVQLQVYEDHIFPKSKTFLPTYLPLWDTTVPILHDYMLHLLCVITIL